MTQPLLTATVNSYGYRVDNNADEVYMPFAEKFRFTMRIPQAGDRFGPFEVESSEVAHHPLGEGRYEYPVTLVLIGPGGKQGVKNALRPILTSKHTTFSGYGNPYQMSFGKSDVVGLGNRRYKVVAQGIGVRIYLERELRRFLNYAGKRNMPMDESAIAGYLEDYQKDARKKRPELDY